MQSGYTQLDAEEREAVRTTGAMTGHLLANATRMTIQAVMQGLAWMQQSQQTPHPIELTASQQQAAEVISVTTERYGTPQEDGGLAFETEKYRFSVSADGLYQAVDKDLNWTVFKFQRSRYAVQAKVADLAQSLAEQEGEYTPEAAATVTDGAVDQLVDRVTELSMNRAQNETESEETKEDPTDSLDLSSPLKGDWNREMASLMAELVESHGQVLAPEIQEGEISDNDTSRPLDDYEDERLSPPDQAAEVSNALIENYGQDILSSPPKRYRAEAFNIEQQGNTYEVQDKDNHPLFRFEKHGNQYHILQDQLTDEQRQQFSRVHTRIKDVALETVMADPTGNTQLYYLEDLAPAGSKAASLTHHQLNLANTNHLETESQKILRSDDQSLIIYAKPDNRTILTASATGEITSHMTNQEAQEFSRAWHHTIEQLQTRQATQPKQPSPATDLER